MFDEEKAAEGIDEEGKDCKTYKKSPVLEKIKRLNVIIKLVLSGRSNSDITSWAMNEWDITDRTVRRYIAEAITYFREEANIDRDAEIGKCLKRYEELFKRNLADNPSIALQSQKEIANLLALNAPKKVELGGEINLNGLLSEFPRGFADEVRRLLAKKLSEENITGTD